MRTSSVVLVMLMSVPACGGEEEVVPIPHLADATRNTYGIREWQTLSGGRGHVHHDGSAWSQVRDSALGAIEGLSRRHDRENAFDYDVRAGHSAEDLDAAVAACNTWYTANRASIPE